MALDACFRGLDAYDKALVIYDTSLSNSQFAEGSCVQLYKTPVELIYSIGNIGNEDPVGINIVEAQVRSKYITGFR